MAKNTPIWKGEKALTEQPNSPLYENGPQGPTITRVWAADYATAFANRPARLTAIAGTDASFKVDTVSVAKQPGGKGILTVKLAPAPVQDHTMADNAVYEVEWVESQLALEKNKVFQPDGDYELSSGDLNDIQEWKNAADATKRGTVEASMSEHAKAFINLLLRGVDSYSAYSPVCRMTTQHPTKPTVTKCGIIEDPPAIIKVAGYVYLKTADRLSRDKTWTRSREWTGALKIVHALYE